jgi:hypothetical protein
MSPLQLILREMGRLFTTGAVLFALLAWNELHAQHLSGTVRDRGSATAIADLELTLGQQRTRTDSAGRFAFRAQPPGVAALRIRGLGFQAYDTSVTVPATGTIEIAILLDRVVVVLDTVVAKEVLRVRSIGREGFAYRQSLGFGKFLDSAFLERGGNRQLGDMIRERGGVDVVVPTTCSGRTRYHCEKRVAASRRQMGRMCLLQVIVDGVLAARGMMEPRGDSDWSRAFNLNEYPVSQVAGVEIYRGASDTPQQWGGASAACGTLVIWTHTRR